MSKVEKAKRILREYTAITAECAQLERVISSLERERARAMHSKVYTDERRTKITDALKAASATLTDVQLSKIARQLEIENNINKLPAELAYVIRAMYILRMTARDIAREMSIMYVRTYSERQIYRYRDDALEKMAEYMPPR